MLCPAELLARMQFLFVSVTPAVENPPNVRRAVLCPAELLARIQFLFVSVTPAVENPPNVRRRSLYTTELQGYMRFYFVPGILRHPVACVPAAGKGDAWAPKRRPVRPCRTRFYDTTNRASMQGRFLLVKSLDFPLQVPKELRENAKKDGFSGKNTKKREEYLAIGWGKDYNIWLVQK